MSDLSLESARALHRDRRARMASRAVYDDGILTPREAKRIRLIKEAVERLASDRRKREQRERAERQAIHAADERQVDLIEDLSKQRAPVRALALTFGILHPTVKLIQALVAAHYGVSPLDIVSGRRTNDVIRPRQAAVYLTKKLTPHSFPEIGRRFGGRDHTTVLHAFRKIESLRETDPILDSNLNEIEAAIELACCKERAK